jgi:hypothetical protein
VADSPSFEWEVEPDRWYQMALYRYYGYCWVQAAGSAEHAAS